MDLYLQQLSESRLKMEDLREAQLVLKDATWTADKEASSCVSCEKPFRWVHSIGLSLNRISKVSFSQESELFLTLFHQYIIFSSFPESAFYHNQRVSSQASLSELRWDILQRVFR